MSLAEIIVLGPGEGRSFSVLGDYYTLKAVGRDTRGAWSLTEVTTQSGAPGPPPHIHDNEEEALYVLEGNLGRGACLPRCEAPTVCDPVCGCFQTFRGATIHGESRSGSCSGATTSV